MKLPDDDELYEVDQTYLGPPRRYIGEMRYRTIFLFLVIAPLTLVLLRKLGMPVTLLSVGLWLIASSFISMKFADYISSESSAGAWLMTFVHELTTPRIEEGELYAAGSADTIRATSRPRGGWARALRRLSRQMARPEPKPAPPKVVEAKVVHQIPATLQAPAQRRAIEAVPVMDEPVVSLVEKAAERSRQVRPAAAGPRPADPPPVAPWQGRPQPVRREHDNPWRGATPWQARQEAEDEVVSTGSTTGAGSTTDGSAADDLDGPERTAIRPRIQPQSVDDYRRALEPDTNDDTNPGGPA